MMDTTDHRVTDYARSIVATLEALEELTALDRDALALPSGPLEEEDREALEFELEDVSSAARALLAVLLEELTLEAHDGDVLSAWLDSALEVTLRGSASLGDPEGWTVEVVDVLVTYGGPTVRVLADGGRYCRVTVSWSSAAVEREAVAPTVSAYLLELADPR